MPVAVATNFHESEKENNAFSYIYSLNSSRTDVYTLLQ